MMHVCLFDIDGTLLNTGGAGQAAMEAAMQSEFKANTSVEGIYTVGRTDRAILNDLFAYHGIEHDEITWRRFLDAYLEHLPQYLAKLEGLVLPGIRALLKQLSEREDVAVGLLTGNYRESARLKLEHYKLFDHFEFGGFGDVHFNRDDVAHDAMREVHRHLNGSVSTERVWVIGDTPADVRCGRAIGANVVAVGTGVFSKKDLEPTPPDYYFDDFSNPQSLLSLLS
jgi:phosphoglycolate phosphatase-like HAD superfamily hydrolase